MTALVIAVMGVGVALFMSTRNPRQRKLSDRTWSITKDWERIHRKMDHLDEQIACLKRRSEELRKL